MTHLTRRRFLQAAAATVATLPAARAAQKERYRLS